MVLDSNSCVVPPLMSHFRGLPSDRVVQKPQSPRHLEVSSYSLETPSSGQCLRLDSGKNAGRSRKSDSIPGGTLVGGASSAKGSIVIPDAGRILRAVCNAKGYAVPEIPLVVHRI
jgi:hypothetical protein